MGWNRALVHPSLGRMRWCLYTYPQLDFGKMPSSLFCVACSEGESHRASMRSARGAADPIEATAGDCFSVDIKTTTTPGYETIVHTAILVSRRTKFIWALHAATKDLLRDKIRAWFLAYTRRYSAVMGRSSCFVRIMMQPSFLRRMLLSGTLLASCCPSALLTRLG